jgi:hypothetical protein
MDRLRWMGRGPAPRWVVLSMILPDLNNEPPGASALRSAEAALAHIQGYAEAANAGTITPAEAIEQVLDELAARPALGRVRAALSSSFSPAEPH